MAYHPYPYPMVEPEFWDDHNTGAVTANLNTQVIDFENLNVLTDYLCTGDYLDPAGNVRRVILSEQGFTAVSASRGNVEQIQAAAYAYAYYIADSNPYIDAFILSRQVDAPSEVRTSCSFGLATRSFPRDDGRSGWCSRTSTRRTKRWKTRSSRRPSSEFPGGPT